MKLNLNFDSKLESIINLCEPLADWFDRNQEMMAYYELIHIGCLHFENASLVSADVQVLGKMANVGLNWLEASYNISPEEKAINAAFSIAKVYATESFRLSEQAKVKYYIDVEEFFEKYIELKTGKKPEYASRMIDGIPLDQENILTLEQVDKGLDKMVNEQKLVLKKEIDN